MATSGNIVAKVVNPIIVMLVAALILGGAAMYGDVQANSNHRHKAEIEQYTQKELLVELNNNVLILVQDMKYARKDIDSLVESQKETNKDLQEARNRELKPWIYQSRPE
jgi:uncharacterized protein HemX